MSGGRFKVVVHFIKEGEGTSVAQVGGDCRDRIYFTAAKCRLLLTGTELFLKHVT